MPQYQISVPGHGTFRINSPTELTDLQVWQAVLAQHPEAGAAPKPAGFSISDTALAGAQGAVGAAKSVASAFGADNAAAQYLEEKQKSLQGMVSPERRAEMARRSAAEKKAAESGSLGEEISTFLGGVAEAPIQSLAQGLGSAAPAIVAGAAALVAGAPAAIAGTVALGARLLMGAVQGAGEVKGSIYDTLTEELKRKGMPEAEAKKQASEAQSYFGKNTDNILVGMGLGALASGTGPVEGVLSRGLAKATGKKLAEEGTEAVEKGLLRRTVVGGAKEALPEGLQGGQEQFAQNVALTRQGIETPAFQGVAGSAARDAAVGALTGAAVSSVGGGGKAIEVGPPTESPAERLQKMEAEKAEAAAAKAAAEAPPQGALFPETETPAEPQLDLFGNPVVPIPEEPAPKEPTLRQREEERKRVEAEGQGRLKLRRTAAKPETAGETIPEPTVRKTQPEGGFSEEEILALGITKKQPIFKFLLGKDVNDPEQRAAVVARLDQYLVKGLGGKGEEGAQARTRLAAFKESLEGVTTPTENENVGQTVEQASGEGPVVAGESGAGVPTGRPVGPEPSGVVSAEPDVGQPVAGEGQQPSAVAPAPAPTSKLAPDSPTPEEMQAEQARAMEAPAPAPSRTPESAKAELDTGMQEVAALTQQQQALLTKAGRKPAAKTPARAKWDALDEQIGAKKEALFPLIDEESKLRRGVKPAAPVEETLAPSAPVRPDITSDPVALLEEVERISGKISQKEYDAFYDKHVKMLKSGDRVENTPESIKAAQDLVRKYGDSETRYRTPSAQPAPQRVIPHKELADIVARIEKSLGGRADITILDSVSNIDPAQRPGTRAGGLIKGKLYLFRDAIPNGTEGEITVFHELFHKGLRNLLAPAEYEALMLKFYNQSAYVKQLANTYLTSPVGKQDSEGKSDRDKQILGVEEALAGLAERASLPPTLARQVGNWLADVAERFGMPNLAGKIRNMKRDPLNVFIHDTLRASVRGADADRLAAMGDRYRVTGEAEKPTVSQKVTQQLGANKVIGLRAKLSDGIAAVDALFSTAYNNSVKDNSGNANPAVLMSRALDAPRFSMAAQRMGTLKMDRDTLVRAAELEADIGQGIEKISYEKAVGEISARARQMGVTPKVLRTNLSDILAGYREYNLAQMGANIDFFLTPQEQAQAKADFDADPFVQRISKMLDAIRFSMIDTMVDVGRLTPELGKTYKEAVGYIPFKRIGEFDMDFAKGGGGKRGLAQMKRMERLKGSEQKETQNVIENFSGLVDWMTTEIMKTQATSRALPEMVLLNAAKQVPSRESLDQAQRGAVVETYIKGEKKFFLVPDPAMLGAFVFEPAQLGSVVKMLQKASQVLRAGVTSMPPFAFKQVADDITRAYVFSGVEHPMQLTARILTNLPAEWINEIRGLRSASTRKMEQSGIIATYDVSEQNNLKNILEETGNTKRSIGSSILRVMEAGAKASDIAVRKAIYDQTIKETKTAANPEGDITLAESRAREIINFSRRGNAKVMDFMIRTVPFFNAYARGMDKLVVAAGGKRAGMTTGFARNLFFKRMTVLAGMGLMYALMMQDDEDYQKLDDHIRDKNWVVPFGKELGFTFVVPIPNELGFFFKAIPERIVQYYKLQGTPEEREGMQILGELVRSGADIFVPPNVLSQLTKPLFENMVNYSFFMDRPLESQMQLKLRPYKREGTSTSDTMKAVASSLETVAQKTGVEAFAVSPIMLENLVRGLLGTSAGVLLGFADALVNPSRSDRPLHQSMGAQLTGASAFMKDNIGSRYISDIYRLERSVEQIANTYKKEAENNPVQAEKFLKDNLGLYSIREGVKVLMGNIRTMNEMATKIDKIKDIDSKERRTIMNEYRRMQNETAKSVYLLRKQAAKVQMEVDRGQ